LDYLVQKNKILTDLFCLLKIDHKNAFLVRLIPPNKLAALLALARTVESN